MPRSHPTSSTSAFVTHVAGLVGTSPAIRRLHTTIERISRYKTNVLILGESGTGKELIARALHVRGPRRDHSFVPINCATLGRDLLENELFGHEKGAKHQWPGNVRELKNAIESAAILSSGEILEADAFEELRQASAPVTTTRQIKTVPNPTRNESMVLLRVGASLATVEKEMMAATLARYPNRREAARVMGIGLRTLYTKMRVYGLDRRRGAKSA
jgi:DNA-binding NtrC family response regulator